MMPLKPLLSLNLPRPVQKQNQRGENRCWRCYYISAHSNDEVRKKDEKEQIFREDVHRVTKNVF